MAARGSSDQVEAVRSQSDIVRLISEYVTLKPSGARLKGLCPFHQEKTPSFTVDPSAQLFYCFGCNTGGDIFKFVMLYEKANFPQALELVARRFGVALERSRRGGGDARERVLEIHRLAERFYRKALADADTGAGARAYLKRRGLSGEIAERLGLGFAPDAWDALLRHMAPRGFGGRELEKAGLAMARRSGNGHYDRFRNRLVFPIRDASGRTVAFGGRALADAQEPKYLNSPETAAYVKGQHLYGLDMAREAIRRKGFAVVVEGYMDLAAVLAAEVDNVVATLGTALTREQARLLCRYTDRVVVCYDGDTAGADAAVRSLDLLLAAGLHVQVAVLPEGKDPDDYIRDEGAEAYRRRIQQAPEYLAYLIEREASRRDLARVEEQVDAANAVLPHIARLDNAIERGRWADRLADALGVESRLVLEELKRAVRRGRTAVRRPVAREEPVSEVEARLVRVLLADAHARETALEKLEPEDLESTQIAGIVEAILRFEREGREPEPAAVMAELDEADRNRMARITLEDAPAADEEAGRDCLRVLRRQRLRREQRRLQRQIQQAENPDAVTALLNRTQQIARQIEALS